MAGELRSRSGLPRVGSHTRLREGQYYVLCGYDHRVTATGRRVPGAAGMVAKVIEQHDGFVTWQSALTGENLRRETGIVLFERFGVYGPCSAELETRPVNTRELIAHHLAEAARLLKDL